MGRRRRPCGVRTTNVAIQVVRCPRHHRQAHPAHYYPMVRVVRSTAMPIMPGLETTVL
jgi:hypothetical protein